MTPEERQAKIARLQKIERIKSLEGASDETVAPVSTPREEPKHPFGWQPTPIQDIMSSASQPMRKALYGTPEEGYDSGTRKIEGANALIRAGSAPFGVATHLLKNYENMNPNTWGGAGAGAVATMAEAIPAGVNYLWNKVSPSVLPSDLSQQKKSAVNELIPSLATIAAIKGVSGIPKMTGKATGAVSRAILPKPERIYSVGAKLGGLGAEADAATYGVKNRVRVGGSYDFQPKNYEANRGQIKSVIETKLNPEIETIQKTGVSLDRSQVLNDVNKYLRENFNGLKTPAGKAKYLKALESLNDEFKQGGQKITPKEMQEGKVATHQTASYDAEGQMANEFNKAVAHVYRKQLETWNPNLKGINKELLNLDILGESIYNEAMRSSKNLPKGESGLPFYIAISNPLKGGAVAAARGMISGSSQLSRTAFLVDRLREMGKTDATSTYPGRMFDDSPVPPAPTASPAQQQPISTPNLYSKLDMVRATNRPKYQPSPAQQQPISTPDLYSKLDMVRATNRPKYQPSPAQQQPPSLYSNVDIAKATKGKLPPEIIYNGEQALLDGTTVPMYTDLSFKPQPQTFIVELGETFPQALARMRARFGR
jgi:hypothetical protein